MNFTTCIRLILVVAVTGSMAWAGANLMSSPASELVAQTAAPAEVIATSNTDGASAVSTLVAESTVGARIIVNTNGPAITGGLRGTSRRRAGSLNLTTQHALALPNMGGGWWFRHSCFIP